MLGSAKSILLHDSMTLYIHSWRSEQVTVVCVEVQICTVVNRLFYSVYIMYDRIRENLSYGTIVHKYWPRALGSQLEWQLAPSFTLLVRSDCPVYAKSICWYTPHRRQGFRLDPPSPPIIYLKIAWFILLL